MSTAKALWPTGVLDIPLFLTTVSAGNPLIDQLHSRGWMPFGEDIAEAAVDAQLVINAAGISLVVERQDLLSDAANPYAPPGWWQAVDRLRQHAVVVVLPHGVDLASIDLEEVRGKQDAAAALVSVTDSMAE